MAGYVTIAEVRAEGVTTDPPSDTRIQSQIDTWSRFIDKATRQWFEERSLTIFLDGTGAPTLWFPVPIIEVSELYLNDQFESSDKLETDDYTIHNSTGIPDDRMNPRIALKARETTIWEQSMGMRNRIFQIGKQNQKVVGKFGYLEDGACPALIKRAVMKMVLKNLDPMYSAGGGGGGGASGPVRSETTDGHSITYAFSESSVGGLFGIAGDAEVVAIIRQYRAPYGGIVVSVSEDEQ